MKIKVNSGVLLGSPGRRLIYYLVEQQTPLFALTYGSKLINVHMEVGAFKLDGQHP